MKFDNSRLPNENSAESVSFLLRNFGVPAYQIGHFERQVALGPQDSSVRNEVQGGERGDIQDLLEAIPTELAVVDAVGSVIFCSRPWKRRCKRSQKSSTTLSTATCPLDFLTANAGDSRAVTDALQSVLTGHSSGEKLQLALGPAKHRDRLLVTIKPMTRRSSNAALIVVEDVTEIHDLRTSGRALADQLLHSEELERRRIAREMHDTTAQDLVAIGLNLKRLTRFVNDDSARDALHEIRAILRHAQQDIRTMSYLLHPPLVEEGGLFVALAALVQGASRRMEIPIDLHCDATEPRLSGEHEIALYRIAQEALINVYRHASASRAAVRYYRDGDAAVLEIRDDGVGFGGRYARHADSGVGILGMRARLEHLGGTIRLSRLDGGTTLKATIPVMSSDPISPGR